MQHYSCAADVCRDARECTAAFGSYSQWHVIQNAWLSRLLLSERGAPVDLHPHSSAPKNSKLDLPGWTMAIHSLAFWALPTGYDRCTDDPLLVWRVSGKQPIAVLAAAVLIGDGSVRGYVGSCCTALSNLVTFILGFATRFNLLLVGFAVICLACRCSTSGISGNMHSRIIHPRRIR